MSGKEQVTCLIPDDDADGRPWHVVEIQQRYHRGKEIFGLSAHANDVLLFFQTADDRKIEAFSCAFRSEGVRGEGDDAPEFSNRLGTDCWEMAAKGTRKQNLLKFTNETQEIKWIQEDDSS